MDLLSLVTSGVNDSEADGPEEDILGWQDDETHNPDVPAISHRRGLTTFVFVPFEEVCSASCIYIYIYIVLLFFLDKCFLWNLVILNSFIIASLKYVVYASRMKESLYTFSVFFIMVKVETSVLNLPVDKMDYFVPG